MCVCGVDIILFFFFSSRRRHTRLTCDWSSDVCSSDLQNPTLDPILFGEMPWIANFEMAQLTKYGMPGVWTHGYVDEWSPGYVGFMSTNHNGLFKMYETFGNGGATTELRHVKPVDGPGEDLHAGDQTGREWFRPSPPYKTVEW